MGCNTKQERIDDATKRMIRKLKRENPDMPASDIRIKAKVLGTAIVNEAIEREKMEEYGDMVDRAMSVPQGAIDELNKEKPRIKSGKGTTAIKATSATHSRIDYTYPNGTKEYSISPKLVSLRSEANMTAEELLKKYSISEDLGSTPRSKVPDDKGGVVLEAKNLNSFEHLTELMDNIDEIDEVGASKEHKEHLKKVVETLVSRMSNPIEEMNVYLNSKTEGNDGMISFKDSNKGIYLSAGPHLLSTDMSLAEAFVHELIHGATHEGFMDNRSELANTLNLLKELRSKALEVLKPEDLMGEVVQNRGVEYSIAKERLDYMAGPQGLEEFLAMALSNEAIFNKLKDVKLKTRLKNGTLVGTLFDVLMTIVDAVMGIFNTQRNRTLSGDKMIMKLVSDMGRINKKAAKINKRIADRTINTRIDDAEDKLKEKFEKFESKNKKDIMTKLANGDSLGPIDTMRAIAFLLTSEEGTPILQEMLSMVGARQEGFVQTIVRHLKHADKTGNRYQELIMASGQVDTHREATAANWAHMINSAFKKKLKTAEKKALYVSMIVGDGLALVKQFGTEKTADMYRDDIHRHNEIIRLQLALDEAIKSQDDRNMVEYQTRGLADLMMTGEASIIQRKNAETIAMYSLKDGLKKGHLRYDVIRDIDTLASLYAIEDQDKTVRDKTAKLLDREQEAMNVMVDLQKSFNTYVEKKVTTAERYNLMKNQHKEVYNSEIDTIIAPVSDKKKMRDEGFTLVEKLPSLGLGIEDHDVALYKNTSGIRQSFNRSMLRYTGDRATGQTLWQDANSRGYGEASQLAVKKQIENGKKLEEEFEILVRQGLEPEITTHVSPVLDSYNRTVGYRTQVPMSTRIKHLGLEANSSVALGRSMAHEVDMEESERLNEMAWEELMEDMMLNAPSTGKTGKNQYEYVDINEMSDIKMVRDANSVMPENIRKRMSRIKKANKLAEMMTEEYEKGTSMEETERMYADNRAIEDVRWDERTEKYELSEGAVIEVVGIDLWAGMKTSRKKATLKAFKRNAFMVRRDMLLDVFGVRNGSLNDIIPKKGALRYIRKTVAVIEQAWREIVKIFKVDIIIRTLPVIFGNIISNFMYSIQYGLNPLEVAKMQLAGVRLLKTYLKDQDELIKVKAKLMSNPNDQQAIRRQNELLHALEYSDIKPLIDAGLYQHIVEDVNLSDLQSSSKFIKWVDEKTEGVPEWIQTAGHALYVSEKTSMFQLITQMTAMSDFTARYAQYTLGIKKEKEKYRRKNDGKRMPSDMEVKLKRDMTRLITDAFVNYSQPDSKLLQYLNDMGFVAFTKYAIRIQKSIADLVQGKPLRFALALLGQELFEGVTDWNPEDIAQHSIYHRDPSDWLYFPGVTKIINNIVEPQMYTYMKELGVAA